MAAITDASREGVPRHQPRHRRGSAEGGRGRRRPPGAARAARRRGFVLLIACANVAHMLLARAAAASRRSPCGRRSARRVGHRPPVPDRERAARARRRRAPAPASRRWGIRALVALGPPDIPRLGRSGSTPRAGVPARRLARCTGVVFGLVPALQASRRDLSTPSTRAPAASTEGFAANRLRSLLLASEFALALVLLIGAGLMIRSFLRPAVDRPRARSEERRSR